VPVLGALSPGLSFVINPPPAIIIAQRFKFYSTPKSSSSKVFSKEGKICAVLSQGPERINLKTKQPDQVTNYKGNGAIGVKIK
jgi:hypothetical protein